MANPQHLRKAGAHSNQETRPCDSSSPRPTVASDSRPPRTGRKRKHRTLSSEHQNTQPESSFHSKPPAKRQRTSSYPSSNTSTNSSSTEISWSTWDRAERSYWDSLSQLLLTSSSLREFNRRNALLRTQASPNGDITVTRKHKPTDIIRFARRGGPDLSDIRQHRDPEEASSTSDTMPRNSKGKAEKRSSAYDGNFEQHLVDNNIFPDEHPRSLRAANHQEWDEVLIQPRASPSRSSDKSFHSFKKAVRGLRDEDEVMSKALPRLVGEPRHASGQNVRFTNLKQITKKIVFPQPDWYEGELPGEGNRTLRKRLNKAIIPSKHKERPFLPTFFAEAKGPHGSPDVAVLQACHDGAVGARAIHSLHSLGGTKAYDGNAYAASATYQGGGDLKLYTHHMTQPRGPGTDPHTHMERIFANNVTNTPRSFREGRTAFRNVADKTDEYRVRFINDANRRNRIVSPPPPKTVSRSTRKPLSCQAHLVESSESERNTSSEEEDSDDDSYRESSRARPKGKLLKPKRLARRSPSPGQMTRRRKAMVSSNADPSSSSEEESSRAPRRRHLPKPKIVTIAPKTRRGSSPLRRGLRPRR